MMEKPLQEAVRNLRHHPGEYTLLAVVLLITVIALPQLQQTDRLLALLSAVVASVFVIAIVRVATSHRPSHHSPVTTFEAREGDKYNYEFYRFFTDKITSAREDIYITGDGFECADQEGLRLAREFTNAFRFALGKGVNVVRVQTRPRANRHWAEFLAELVEGYPDQFRLFILKDEGLSQMTSVCVIDPEERAANMVEFMISTEKLFGIQAASLAGTAVFIEGRRVLAKDVRDRIRSLCSPDYTVHCATGRDVRGLLAGTDYYFAFGSNMQEAQMLDRCPSARRIDVGVLLDHMLVFNRRGSYRPGGVASVEGVRGERVYGVIYSLNPLDLEELDRREDPSAYRRTTEIIKALDGKEYACHVYKALPEGTFRPDAEYLSELVTAAEENQLPTKYIERLKEAARAPNVLSRGRE